MKTFTLRLNEQESEALERLAVVEGKSKNRCITRAIANSLKEYEKRGNIIDGAIFSLSDVEEWPGVYENRLWEKINGRDGFVDEYEIKALNKIYKYALKEAKDAAAAEQLKNQLQKFRKEINYVGETAYIKLDEKADSIVNAHAKERGITKEEALEKYLVAADKLFGAERKPSEREITEMLREFLPDNVVDDVKVTVTREPRQAEPGK